jgi:26S proteasome regulatory subunit N10
MLALKHRQNKSQRQRVVIFSGSPIAEDEASLVKLGKKLKKNNVAVDVVAFANVDVNEAKLQARRRRGRQRATRLRAQGPRR